MFGIKQKKTWLSLVLLLSSIELFGATFQYNGGVVSWKTDKQFQDRKIKRSRSLSSEKNEALSYINQLREGTGLVPFSLNTKLNQAAQNHANYMLANNIFSHSEDSSKSDYTGVNPWDRGDYAGYDSSSYAENISAGNSNVKEAIDGLFVAIYHRLGFLSFTNEDLGIGSFYNSDYYYGSAHVFNMGTEKPKYGNDVADSNPAIVIWPYSGYQKAQPAFFNTESPAPLPECSTNGASGNPISVEFNPYKSGDITTNNFRLYAVNGHQIETKFLDSQSSNHLRDKEFVLFPINRLDWDSRYRVVYDYTEDGTEKHLDWYYKTRKLDYPILKLAQDDATYDVVSGKTYAFYVVPQNCNETGNYYSSYDSSKISMVGNWIDPNTHYVKIKADVGEITTLKLGNGKKFYLNVKKEEQNQNSSKVKSDFNGDGIDDIFWRDGTKNGLWIMKADGTHKWIPQVAKIYDIAGIGDFNGDGVDDIFWRDGTKNGLWIMKADGTHKWVPQVEKTYDIAGIGDFNGDGIDDIFWRDGTKNGLWIMKADGTHKWVPQISKATDYVIDGIGDYDGDGIDDIHWRNGAVNGIWYMHQNASHTWKRIADKSATYQAFPLPANSNHTHPLLTN